MIPYVLQLLSWCYCFSLKGLALVLTFSFFSVKVTSYIFLMPWMSMYLTLFISMRLRVAVEPGCRTMAEVYDID